MDLGDGETFEIDPPKDITVAVRASMNGSTGEWHMSVYGIRNN